MPEYISTNFADAVIEPTQYISTDPNAAEIIPSTDSLPPGFGATTWTANNDPNLSRMPTDEEVKNAPKAIAVGSEYIPKSILEPSEEKQIVIDYAKAHPAVEHAAEAASELVGGFIPHSPDQYIKQLFPPFAAIDQAKEMMEGNFKSIPFVGRIQDIREAEQTPAYSKERFLAAGKTLMDLGLIPLAGKAPEAVGRTAEVAKAAETPKSEPTTIIRVSPETGEVFHVDPKTGEVVQPKYVSTDPAAAQIEPAAETPTLPITQEQYGQEVRQEPAITGTAESGGPGQQPAPVEIGVSVAAPETARAGETTGGEVGISQARTEAELGPGSVEPGIGAELGSGTEFGRNYINEGRDPRLPIRRAMASGLVGKNEVGIVNAELERLRAIRNAAADEAAAKPDDPVAQAAFDAADKAQRAWRKELQPVLTKAGDALREANAANSANVDLGSYRGLSDLVDEHFKGQRELSPVDRTRLQRVAKGVQNVRGDAIKSVEEVSQRVRKSVKRVMTPDELHADLAEALKGEFSDCII